MKSVNYRLWPPEITQLGVRIPLELRRAARQHAIKHGLRMQDVIAEAIREKLRRVKA
jgi:hypothetical protein